MMKTLGLSIRWLYMNWNKISLLPIMRRLTIFLILAGNWLFAQTPGVADFDKTPVVRWKFKSPLPFISSPVISNGIVYIGGTDSTLYALRLDKGTIQWKLKTNGSIRSTVIIEGTRIYLAGGNGVLSCIDKDSGKPLWRTVFDPTAIFLAERSYDFADYYHSSPVIYKNMVYIGSGNGRMNAYSSDNGTLLWSFKAGDIIHNNPVIYQDKLYFGCFDGNVYALNIVNGDLIWKFKSLGHQYFPAGEVQGSPASGFGSIFLGARDYNFYALNAATGNANWNVKFNGGWALSSTVNDTTVYIGTSDDRVLVAVDARNGYERWRTNVKYNIFGGCSFSKGMVYVGTIWGKLYGIDKKTGAIRWAFETDGYTANSAKYFKGDGSFRDDIGSILKSPIQWIAAEQRMGGIFSTPAVAENVIVFTSTEGIVYCISR